MSSDGARAGKAYVELGVKNNLRRDLAQGEQMLRAWGARLATAGSILVGASAAGLGIFGGMAKSFADAGSKVYDMSKKTGISAESLSGLQYAADQTGTSIDSVAKSMGAMAKFTTALASGNNGAATTMQQLGIDTKAFLATSPEKRLGMIADALNNIQDEGIRAGMAAKVLGKSGMDLLPMLEGGSAGLASMTDRARKMGWVLSEEAAKAADELGDTMDDLKQTFMGIVNNIGASVAPAFTIVGKIIVGLGSYVIRLIKMNQGFVMGLLIATAAVGVLGASLLALASVTYAGAFALWMYNTALGLYAAMSTIATVVTTGFAAAMAFLQAVMMPANLAILLITASLAVFVALLPLALYKAFELSSIGGAAIDAFGTRVSGAFDTAMIGLKAFASAMGNGDLEGAAKIASAAIGAVWNKLGIAIQGVFMEVGRYITNVMYDAMAAVNKAVTLAKIAAVNVTHALSSPEEKTKAAMDAALSGQSSAKEIEKGKRAANKAYDAYQSGLDTASNSIDAGLKKTIDEVAKKQDEKREQRKNDFAFSMPEMETVKRALSGGAFNAAAARNLASTPGSLMDRQVKEQEKTNKNLEKLQKQLADMGLEWGT